MRLVDESPIGKVVVHRSMSLDGYITGAGDAMEWIFENIPADGFPEITATIGAALVGRRTYDVGRRDAGKSDGEFHGGASSAPIFVLTHEPPTERDPHVTFVTSDVASAVATALKAAKGHNLEILGTDLAEQCFESGLVDEILIHIHPVLLRSGTRLTNALANRLTRLEPISTTVTGRITSLRFLVAS